MVTLYSVVLLSGHHFYAESKKHIINHVLKDTSEIKLANIKELEER